MKQKAHLGASTTKTIVVERGLVQRFVDALEISDPICTDPKAADQAGLPGVMLPPSAAGSLGDYTTLTDLLELKPKQVLHAQEHVSLFSPVCAGDELTITTTLRDVYEQHASGNPMGFVVIDVVGTGKKSDDVRFEAQRTLVVRGGLPRR
ncbi:MAG: MaoC family dehydratase N-terminal domain-containing protein [Deltaproteobacteria bacterium]|nr:MaoC family dehydratase N-terminal domain-containing protein [Deltaproteobacteria bacterium]